MQRISPFLRRFVHDEDGAQVIEYALIIAVVSIVLIIALKEVVTDATWSPFIDKVTDCLSGTCA